MKPKPSSRRRTAAQVESNNRTDIRQRSAGLRPAAAPPRLEALDNPKRIDKPEVQRLTEPRSGKPKTIDDYLAALSGDQRAALEKLRKIIRAAAPKAEECISYQLPAFRLNGMLVAFGATANHCAFYPMSSSTVEAHKDELKNYETSKGTIRFQADKPLPAALVRKLVKARIVENGGG